MSSLAAGVSIEMARRILAQELRDQGIDTPEVDARLLVGHALGLDHPALTAQSQRAITPAEADAIAALAARRRAHEPVARILGRKEFWGLPLALNADTLVPRPETETVVEAALKAVEPPSRIADLGTGTGALLLALLSELPGACGIGTDISTGALACARANAAALGLARRASFVACDHASALRGPFDLIVSNPPYVARTDIAALPPEVRNFDPRRALDGGPDGLDAYRVIVGDAPRLLAPGGALVLELGFGQLEAVTSLLSGAGLAATATRNDLAGVPRALVARPFSRRLP